MKAQAKRQNAKEDPLRARQAARERDVQPGARVTPAGVSRIQRKAACACGGGCPSCQESKLQVSSPGDAYEQEADRVAGEVMRMAEPHGAVAPAAPSEAGAQTGAGEPLSASAREFFEPRFGHSFNDVRVHTDARAAQRARSLNALAYTTGKDVVFADGQYAPETQAGRTLLAHELTHVVQQRGAAAPQVQRKVTPGCVGNESSAITSAVAQAHTNLETAIRMLSQSPLTQPVKDAMWLAFREDSDLTAKEVLAKLRILKANIQAADYTCVNSAHPRYTEKCETEDKTYGFVSAEVPAEGGAETHVGPINLCMPRFANYVEYQQSRAVIHEASHRFLNVDDLGYFSMSEDLSAPECQETSRSGRSVSPQDSRSGTAGDVASVRLNNADAFACFVHFLVYAPVEYLTPTAKQYRGGELKIKTDTRVLGENEDYLGDIYTMTGTPGEPSFRIVGVPENSGFQFRWSFVAGSIKFSPLSRRGTTAATYDERNTEVYIGPGARSTLAGSGVTEGKLICEAQLVGPFDPLGANVQKVEKTLKIRQGQDPNDPSL